jgi:hypothetical protein
MKSQLLKILQIFFILGILSSCNAQKISVIKDNPCSPPCWYEITPGETSYEDTFKLLPLIPKLKIIDHRISGVVQSSQKLIFPRNYLESMVIIRFSEEQTADIEIVADKWNVQDLFRSFNEPEYYVSYFEQIERIDRWVLLIYPKNAMVVSVYVGENYELNSLTNNYLTLDSSLYSIRFLPRKDFQNNWGNYLTGFGTMGDLFMSQKHKWEGLGELETFHLE